MPSLPAKKSGAPCLVRSGMPPSVTMRPRTSIAFLPAGPSKATFFSSARQHRAAVGEDQRLPHPVAGDLPVEVEAATLPSPSALIFFASSKMPSQVGGSCRGRRRPFTRSALK